MDTVMFGPQTTAIEALIERVAALSPDEEGAFTETVGFRLARGSVRDEARNAARGATWDSVRDEAWGAAWVAAHDAACGASWDSAWNAALDPVLDAMRDALLALTVRDHITQHRFTQDYYDTLTRPWALVIGKVHPDDADIAS